MSQITPLVSALKRALKQHAYTYADVAVALSLSEASVKRLFAREDFTLERLAKIAAMMQMDLIELLGDIQQQPAQLAELSAEQEEELISDTRLLLTAVCALNHWRFEEIIAHYQISEHELIQALARLDRLKILELLPGNRIRPCVARDFRWRAGGAIERFFRARVQQEFLKSRFDAPGEHFTFATGMLSWAANAQLQERILRLVAEFTESHRRDSTLPLSDRHGNGLMIALRPFDFGAFEALKR